MATLFVFGFRLKKCCYSFCTEYRSFFYISLVISRRISVMHFPTRQYFTFLFNYCLTYGKVKTGN